MTLSLTLTEQILILACTGMSAVLIAFLLSAINAKLRRMKRKKTHRICRLCRYCYIRTEENRRCPNCGAHNE